jgi:hypothetical protein
MKLLKLGFIGVFMIGASAPSYAGNIAFSSDRDHAGSHEIYVMKDDGSSQTRLTYNMGDCRTPAVSPDGRKLLSRRRRFPPMLTTTP